MTRRRRKRCAICGSLFLPHVRLGARQRTCGDPGCRRAQKRRAQQAWRARNPNYQVDVRLRRRAERLKESPGLPLRAAPVPVEKLPWEFAVNAVGTEGAVLLAWLLRQASMARLAGRRNGHQDSGVVSKPDVPKPADITEECSHLASARATKPDIRKPVEITEKCPDLAST